MRIFKSKVLLIIITFQNVMDETGIAVGQMKEMKRDYVNISGRELQASVDEQKRRVEVVYEEPQRIQQGVVYVLPDGKRAWIYKLS